MSKPYASGAGTKANPIKYEITEEFLLDVEKGQWSSTMIAAMVKELRRLRKEKEVSDD